jgi:hypothetical protein
MLSSDLMYASGKGAILMPKGMALQTSVYSDFHADSLIRGETRRVGRTLEAMIWVHTE